MKKLKAEVVAKLDEIKKKCPKNCFDSPYEDEFKAVNQYYQEQILAIRDEDPNG